MNISIFAKPTFLNVNSGQPFVYKGEPPKRGHLMRVSSMIRGDQIAEQVGAKLNPTSGYENDVCIYVKPMVRKGDDFTFEGKPYLDIVDGRRLLPLVVGHSEVTVITCSQADLEYVSRGVPNKVILIPQHHCNFERAKKSRDGITTVGCIGTTPSFTFLPQGLKEELAERGIELLEFSTFFTRQDVVDFYMKIDIQVIWRPYINYNKGILGNPLKIVNSSSFGVPTIALEEPVFKEMKGCYIPVKNLEEFLIQLDKLASSPSLYAEYSERCLKKAEEYHIENIAKLYLKLV